LGWAMEAAVTVKARGRDDTHEASSKTTEG
jgi:hypothetical protein